MGTHGGGVVGPSLDLPRGHPVRYMHVFKGAGELGYMCLCVHLHIK